MENTKQYKVIFKHQPKTSIKNPVWNDKLGIFEADTAKYLTKQQAQVKFNSVLIMIRQQPEYKDDEVCLWENRENAESRVILRGTFDHHIGRKGNKLIEG